MIRLDRTNFIEIVNICKKIYYPVNKIITKQEFITIINKFKFNNFFFPLPTYVVINQKNFIKKKNVYLYYQNKKAVKINNFNTYTFSELEKKKISKKFFLTGDIKHPGLKKFYKDSKKTFISGNISWLNINLAKKIKFSDPAIFKKKFKGKLVAGFHSRNVPHKGHQWIHNHGLKICKNLFIQPMVGQYKKGEYKEKVIIKTNKILENNSNIFFGLLNTFPRYAGPREGAFHAIIRKNFGCSHFLVGRDHAGVANFYNKYQTQNFCKKNEKNLKIKIICFNEPYYCTGCNKIVNKNCANEKCKKKIMLNGKDIRLKIIKKQKIYDFILDKKIKKILYKMKQVIIS